MTNEGATNGDETPKEECDHLVGLNSFPYEGHWPVKKSDKWREFDGGEIEFTFCPKCGEKLINP